MQCKDIPTDAILIGMLESGKPNGHPAWHMHWRGTGDYNVRNFMPHGQELDDNLVRAKMSGLLRRGLVDGCACGCRGDWRLTEKGEAKAKDAIKDAIHKLLSEDDNGED